MSVGALVIPGPGGPPAAMPLAGALAMWLLSAAPGTVTFGVSRRIGLGAEHQVLAQFTVCLVVAGADMLVFGLPRSDGPLAWVAVLGCLAGALYYGIERARLAIAHREDLRSGRRSAWTPAGIVPGMADSVALGAAVLAVSGAAEESLFRWYVLVIPLMYGVFGVPACVAVSVIGCAVLHHELGVGAMVARGLFGLAAALIVALTGWFLAVVFAHAAYNVLVQLRPVQYLRLQEVPRS